MARRADPPPLETNDVRAAIAGTIAWAVALVVLLIIGLPERDRWWLWVCVAGIATGLFGIVYIPYLQRHRAAADARHTAHDAEDRQAAVRDAAEQDAAEQDAAEQDAVDREGSERGRASGTR